MIQALAQIQRTIFFALLFGGTLMGGLLTPNIAAAEPITLSDAIREVLATHPDLTISHIQREKAEASVQTIEAQLDPLLGARIGYSDESNPVTNSFSPTGTTSSYLQGQASLPLASGGTLEATAQYSKSKVTAPFPLNPNPAYRGQIDLSYRHPLMKGAGRPDYHDAKKAAIENSRMARAQDLGTARQLALQTLTRYYTLSRQEITLQLAKESVERAERLLAFQKRQERLGLIEAADRAQTEAFLAARRLDLENSRAQLAAAQTSLARLMQSDTGSPVSTAGKRKRVKAQPISTAAAIDAALAKRPEFVALTARIAAAEAKLHQSMDKDEMMLDIIAQAGTRSQDAKAGKAFNSSFGGQDHFVGIALELGGTVGSEAGRSQIRLAELDRQQALAERRQLEENIKTEISNLLTTIRSEQRTLRAVEEQVTAEQRKYDMEMKRYKNGRSSTATIIQFEGELFSARLQAALRRIVLEQNLLQLAWSMGEFPGPAEMEEMQ